MCLLRFACGVILIFGRYKSFVASNKITVRQRGFWFEPSASTHLLCSPYHTSCSSYLSSSTSPISYLMLLLPFILNFSYPSYSVSPTHQLLLLLLLPIISCFSYPHLLLLPVTSTGHQQERSAQLRVQAYWTQTQTEVPLWGKLVCFMWGDLAGFHFE